MINQPNWVLWFTNAIKSLGGEYEPFRDFENETPKKHTSGRREINRDLRMVQIARWEKQRDQMG